MLYWQKFIVLVAINPARSWSVNKYIEENQTQSVKSNLHFGQKHSSESSYSATEPLERSAGGALQDKSQFLKRKCSQVLRGEKIDHNINYDLSFKSYSIINIDIKWMFLPLFNCRSNVKLYMCRTQCKSAQTLASDYLQRVRHMKGLRSCKLERVIAGVRVQFACTDVLSQKSEIVGCGFSILQ